MGTLNRIKEETVKKRISIAELERRADVGNGTIRNWDKALPSADKLYRVSKVLNVSMEYLLDGKKDDYIDKEIYREFTRLNERQKEAIINLIKVMNG